MTTQLDTLKDLFSTVIFEEDIKHSYTQIEREKICDILRLLDVNKAIKTDEDQRRLLIEIEILARSYYFHNAIHKDHKRWRDIKQSIVKLEKYITKFNKLISELEEGCIESAIFTGMMESQSISPSLLCNELKKDDTYYWTPFIVGMVQGQLFQTLRLIEYLKEFSISKGQPKKRAQANLVKHLKILVTKNLCSKIPTGYTRNDGHKNRPFNKLVAAVLNPLIGCKKYDNYDFIQNVIRGAMNNK